MPLFLNGLPQVIKYGVKGIPRIQKLNGISFSQVAIGCQTLVVAISRVVANSASGCEVHSRQGFFESGYLNCCWDLG